MRLPVVTLALLVFTLSPALACSPAADELNRPFSEKVGMSPFLGRVTSVTAAEWQKPGSVTFDVISSRGEPAPDTSITVPYQNHGTCGVWEFEIGQVWLYAGDDPFGATLQPTADDLGVDNGADMEALIVRIEQRLSAARQAQ